MGASVERPRNVVGNSWKFPGSERLGVSWDRPGNVWGRLEGSGTVLGASGRLSERLGAVGNALGAS